MHRRTRIAKANVHTFINNLLVHLELQSSCKSYNIFKTLHLNLEYMIDKYGYINQIYIIYRNIKKKSRYTTTQPWILQAFKTCKLSGMKKLM